MAETETKDTILRLGLLLSPIILRIKEKGLDKDADQCFNKVSAENCADRHTTQATKRKRNRERTPE